MTKTQTNKLSAQDKYNNFISDYLELRLFESAINLNQSLIEKFKVSPDNARQIIKRAVSKKVIKSSAPYTFGKGQYIYIYNGFVLDKASIKTISKKNRPPIYRLLELMDMNGGIISYYEALKICASPLEDNSTKVSSLDDILKLLFKLDIVYKKRDSNNVVYIIYKHEKESLDENVENLMIFDHYAKMVLDCSVLPDILRWLGNSNLIINTNAIYRNKKNPALGAKHNNLIWDAFAYTKSTGINPILPSKAHSEEKQTLVVIDIVLASEYSQVHLDGFYNRIQINRNSVLEKERKILPIIIYQSATERIINTVRKLGIIAFEISAIFGKKIYDILSKTKELSSSFNQNYNIDNTIESILKSINNAGQEDALKELKGTLFEFLMYPLLSSLYPVASIKRGQTISRLNKNGDKEGYEYDYIIHSTNPSEIIIVELKGYHSGATIPLGDFKTKGSLKWFFSKTFPFAVKEYKSEISKGMMVKAVYITSGNFWDDGKQFLSELDKGKLKSVALNTGYDRSALLDLL